MYRVPQVFMYKNVQKTCKNVQKHAKNVHLKYLCIKNVHFKFSFLKKTCKNVQKRASQVVLDPIQKRASSRSVQLEAVLLKALLYVYVLSSKYIGEVATR